MGIGIAALVGSIGSILAQIIFTDAKELGVNPFLIIAVIFLVATVAYQWMPETYEMEPQDQIKEMREP